MSLQNRVSVTREKSEAKQAYLSSAENAYLMPLQQLSATIGEGSQVISLVICEIVRAAGRLVDGRAARAVVVRGAVDSRESGDEALRERRQLGVIGADLGACPAVCFVTSQMSHKLIQT